jgi:hypothetical protein
MYQTLNSGYSREESKGLALLAPGEFGLSVLGLLKEHVFFN